VIIISNQGTGGGGTNISTIALNVEDNATKKMKEISEEGKQFNKDMDDKRVKLAALWAAGNQMATMLLNQLARASEGTKNQARIQAVLSGLQLAQSQYAVVQAQKQAFLALASQNYVQYGILQALAIGMQSTVIQGVVQQQAALRAERVAEQYQSDVDTWRQSYN
jgi:hypothetical protein